MIEVVGVIGSGLVDVQRRRNAINDQERSSRLASPYCNLRLAYIPKPDSHILASPVLSSEPLFKRQCSIDAVQPQVE